MKKRPRPIGGQAKSRRITLTPGATALTIAGSDPSGGAGLQADLKAFQQNGVYGMSVITLVTMQNTQGVGRMEVLPTALIVDQLEAVLSDIRPLSLKTGALGTAEVIRSIAAHLKHYTGDVVVDPVLVSKHGHLLADDSAVEAYRKELFPIATLITPNKLEAEKLLGRQLDDVETLVQAAQDLQAMGPEYVLIKAGVVDGMRMHVFVDETKVVTMSVSDHATNQTHGAGCSLSATITAKLALMDPKQIDDRVRLAVDFAIAAVHHAIGIAPGLGSGWGPIESRILHMGP